ncbi:predicted protein [Nematostella vectensis]|uniref:RNA-binding protein 4.1-like n=1 Tax=Nematostella vectensis TaxID=45351 RepID=A7T285_NEMVE|nr:RNA-binding protein 4.1 isoform X2 [Nematostella vectensis]EDO29930.1 predicted protein [Nematostella vectensis]|eukprot:XP_001622030.1 hypothetical protein NEMVEDRAFT_v1g248588 [Nematostella vectensis]
MADANETVGESSAEALTQSDTPENHENTAQNGEHSSESQAEATSSGSHQEESKLYVGNLPDDCQKHQLQELFAKYGTVSQCDRVKNFAFVHMVGRENADNAIKALDDSLFMGTHIQVQHAKSKGKPAEDECFHCGKCGHWARDCPKRSSYQPRSYGRDGRYHPYGGGGGGGYGGGYGGGGYRGGYSGGGYGGGGYGRPPPPRDYYRDRPGPPRDYRGPSGYRSRSPGYTGNYEGYGNRGYNGRSSWWSDADPVFTREQNGRDVFAVNRFYSVNVQLSY